MGYDAALAGQMIETPEIAGWDTAKRFFVEIDRSFKAVRRANQENDWLVAWEEAYTTEKKFPPEERIVILTGAFAQFCNLRSHPHDGSMATQYQDRIVCRRDGLRGLHWCRMRDDSCLNRRGHAAHYRDKEPRFRAGSLIG
jgi:hypothetical protein